MVICTMLRPLHVCPAYMPCILCHTILAAIGLSADCPSGIRFCFSLPALLTSTICVLMPGRCGVQENCVACLRDIARGMEYIQSKKVIHGDLKPSNVLFRCSTASADATPTASLSQWDAGRNAAAGADSERQPSQQEHLRAGPAGGTASRVSNRALLLFIRSSGRAGSVHTRRILSWVSRSMQLSGAARCAERHVTEIAV